MSSEEYELDVVLYRASEAFERRAIRCRTRDGLPQFFETARGEYVPDRPIEFVPAEGDRLTDWVGTTYAPVVLISPRVVDVLEAFTGWTTFPVRLDHPGATGYRGLAVTGRCGSIDDSRSEVIFMPPAVPGGRPRRGLKGLHFDLQTWDGSDVFTPETWAAVFVVDALRQALEEAKITNLRLEPLAEIERRSTAGRPAGA